MAAPAEATFWFVLPSLPMFVLAVLARARRELRASVPAMLRNGFLPVLASLPDWLRASVWVSLAAGRVLTVAL